MADIEMPALGESVTEGTVTRWLKSVGDTVEVDEPLLEVSTDKVDTEIPSPVAGTLTEILVELDETVEVGAKLAVIGDHSSSSQPAVDNTPANPPTSTPEATSPPEPDNTSATPTSSGGENTEGKAVEMPALGESVTEGTVTRWLKSVGDTVEVDEPLLEVSTDKVDTEIPSPVAGTLLSIDVDVDETVDVGATLARIGSMSGQSAPVQAAAPVTEEPPLPQAAPSRSSAPATTRAAAHASQQASTSAPVKRSVPTTPKSRSKSESTNYITPLVRKLADQHDVDLKSLQGSGVGGRIRKQDILDAAEAKAEQPSLTTTSVTTGSTAPSSSAPQLVAAKRGTTESMSRLRKVIASRMVESLQTSAQLTTVVEVDVTKVTHLRQREKDAFAQREGVRLSFLPFFAVAAVDALKEFPMLNASIDGENIIYHGAENLGIAVDTERGLLVPVIQNAGDLNVAGMARKIAELADRTRNNSVSPDELSGGTFTLTNTGSRGALFDTPIVNQPQVGILGTGAVVKRPVVVRDEYGTESIAVRSMVYLALSYDHRLVDGADAARFLTAVKDRLEEAHYEV